MVVRTARSAILYLTRTCRKLRREIREHGAEILRSALDPHGAHLAPVRISAQTFPSPNGQPFAQDPLR